MLSILTLGACNPLDHDDGQSATESELASPVLSFTTDTATVAQGEKVRLIWDAQRAVSCQASGDWSGSRPLSGEELIGPLQTSASFSLSCSGNGGAVLRSVSVMVGENQQLDVSLAASRREVLQSDVVTLTWDAPGASTCAASGDWNGNKAPSGSESTIPIVEDVRFTLDCTNAEGSVSGQAEVTVRLADRMVRWRAPTETVGGDPIDEISKFVMYWETESRDTTGEINIEGTARSLELELPSGEYYLALSVVDSEGLESSKSNEISKLLP